MFRPGEEFMTEDFLYKKIEGFFMFSFLSLFLFRS